MKIPEGFVECGGGVLAREGYERDVEQWLERSRHAPPSPSDGGRGDLATEPLHDGGRAYVRRYRRGGLLRNLLRDVYWDRPPRPWRELVVTTTARQRGVLAPEVLGAGVLPLAESGAWSWLYRGVLVTRALEGRDSLAVALRREDSIEKRRAWLDCAVRGIRHLHASGIRHPDLNVTNLLVAPDPAAPIAVIDFDRASVAGGPIGFVGRFLARRRLSRSVAKLGLSGLTRSQTAALLRGILVAEGA